MTDRQRVKTEDNFQCVRNFSFNLGRSSPKIYLNIPFPATSFNLYFCSCAEKFTQTLRICTIWQIHDNKCSYFLCKKNIKKTIYCISFFNLQLTILQFNRNVLIMKKLNKLKLQKQFKKCIETRHCPSLSFVSG